MYQRYKIPFIHIAVWTIYILILFMGTINPDYAFWANTLSTIIPIILLFYTNIYFIFPRYLKNRRFLLVGGLLIILNFAAIGLRILLVTLFLQTSIDSFLSSFFSPVVFWNQFRVNLLFIGISFAYWYAAKSYQSEKDQQILEREILDARLSALKSQINPHFLYNTLSLIYTKSLPHSTELANAISRLSDMMRYSLEETGDEGKVPLEKEIAHINNFISIQQMRFDHKLNIEFNLNGNTNQHRIMPLLLITFVENAFKHGDLNHPGHPLLITLIATDNSLMFTTQNKKSTWKKEQAHGIGLQNVRNRLQILYPEKHELIVKDDNTHFTINLKIAI
jgi:two-component system, LytTR family, sensor kinase